MICVYKYGLASPHTELDRILDQMRCAHRYRNALVEIERGRRAAERAMMLTHAPGMASLVLAAEVAEKAVDEAVRAIRGERARTRKRSESPDLKARLKAAKEVKRTCVEAVRQMRRDLRESPAVEKERDRISELALGLGRGARALSGLAKAGPHFGAWGTYQLVEEAAKASFASVPLYERDGITPSDPHFLRWMGEGAVSVQIQGGVEATKVMEATDEEAAARKQIRITPPDERAWLKMPSNGCSARRRYARQAEIALCLGTDAEGARIYGHWRLDMHRELPDGAVIQRATVHCRRSGPHAYWALELTVECPVRAVLAPTVGGTVAIDIGWRVIGDELRVAGWTDSHGASGEWRLDAKTLRALREPEQIRSMRDSLFDLQILRLSAWLAAVEVPDGLRKEASSLRQWKSAARLVSLRNRWRDARFDGDAEAFDALDAWATADSHYWEQESRRRDAALRWRREQYRVIAARLAVEYETIVLEQFDLRVFAVRAPVEGVAENETARSNRHLAALSELRTCIVNAARARSREVAAMPAHDTTRICPTCGLVEDRPAAANIVLACECGAAWDQDVAGAPVVLLSRWRERPGDAKILVGARAGEKDSASGEKVESRRERVTRMRKAKVARMQAAREASADDAE